MVPSVLKIVRQRGAAVAVAAVACGVLVGAAGSATAAPAPTLSQAKAKLASLSTQFDKLTEHYDQVKQELAATTQRLSVLDKEQATDTADFNSMRAEVGQIAIAAYEDGNINSSIALLSSGNPQQILNQSSMLQELSTANNAKISQFLSYARQLTRTQQMAARTRAGIVKLTASLKTQQASLATLVSKQKALVTSLTPVQKAAVTAATTPGASGSTSATDNVPVNSAAGKAVQFAYDQLGCPYVYAGVGPCNQGFDCSGLTQQAWAAAGVSIERTSEDQWASLPHVSESDLQPGDIMEFDDEGHVGIYVGNNQLIDAPHTGADVELVDWSGWYKTEYDGAVRP